MKNTPRKYYRLEKETYEKKAPQLMYYQARYMANKADNKYIFVVNSNSFSPDSNILF